jgi:predicted membrane-bound spermidine synthase
MKADGPPTNPVLFACLFGSGAAALICEIVWLRHFSLVMGQTVYALSAVLTAFFGGLALGSFVGGRLCRRRGGSFYLFFVPSAEWASW